MTTTATPPPPSSAETDDPYLYGWRYVQHDLPDGNIVVEQVPLTLEDVLHPEEGDQVTHSAAHQRRVRYLCDVFEAQLAHDTTAVVLDDVRVKWDVPDLRPHGPDIMVIFGVRERKNWGTFDVAEEGTRPALIIEITSPSTRVIDLVTKLDHYDLAGVPLYVIVDAVERRGQEIVRLLGYHQTATVYTPLVPDERGWMWLEPLKLWLGVRDNEIYCFDAAGNQIGNYADVTRARSDAEARATTAEAYAASAEARATTAEARVRELEAELRRLQAE